MSAYFVATYNVSDKDGFAKYNPGSMGIITQTLAKHGGEVVVAGHDCTVLHGENADVKVILKFPSVEAANAWHDDPDYAPAKAIRLASTTNIQAIIIEGFVLPS
jgi:uncharacterized protein (DUF1330 family)